MHRFLIPGVAARTRDVVATYFPSKEDTRFRLPAGSSRRTLIARPCGAMVAQLTPDQKVASSILPWAKSADSKRKDPLAQSVRAFDC